jgi:hypothetical protein
MSRTNSLLRGMFAPQEWETNGFEQIGVGLFIIFILYLPKFYNIT